MPSSQQEEWEALADVFSGVAHPARVAVVQGLHEDRSIPDIVEDLSITRGGLQNHLETLIDAQLVYRTGESDAPYALTPIGLYFAVLLEDQEDVLLSAVEMVQEAEAQSRDEFADVPMSDEEVDKQVTRRKWELVGDELYEVLDVPPDNEQ